MNPEPPIPDMVRVIAALNRYGNKPRAGKTHIEYPRQPSPVARDAAIRKPLKAHGVPCSGFSHPHFLNRD